MQHTILWLFLGLVGGLVFLTWARSSSPTGQRRVLAAGLWVAALIYGGFGALGPGGPWLLLELAGVGLFGLLAWLGWKHSVLWLAFGWGLHSLWDGLLHLHGAGAVYTPTWYVLACLSFDVLVAAWIFTQRQVWTGGQNR